MENTEMSDKERISHGLKEIWKIAREIKASRIDFALVSRGIRSTGN